MAVVGQVLELDENEGATCLSLVRFDSPGNAGTYLAVGTAQGLTFNPRQADGGLLSSCRTGSCGCLHPSCRILKASRNSCQVLWHLTRDTVIPLGDAVGTCPAAGPAVHG